MDNIILSRRWVQGTPVTIDNLTGTAFTGEAQAHTFRISGVDAAGADVQITGTVTGAFLAPNNTTIPLTGTITDGVAEVTLTSQCYELPGRFILSVYAANGDTNLCIYCGVGYVFCTETDQVAYPSAAIPDISQLIQEAQDVIDSIPEDYSALSAHFPATGKFVTGGNTVTGDYSSAIGQSTQATGAGSHAEGKGTQAVGAYSHAEGENTTATGTRSHAEGRGTSTLGFAAHSEGDSTYAQGQCSHAEGYNTTATHHSQHVFGRYNALDPSENAASQTGTYAEIVGNGTANARSNARTLDWSGNEALSGDLTINKNGENEMTVGQELSDLKSAVSSMNTATSADEGKALKAKTVENGVVTEWEFGEAGGRGLSADVKTALLACFEKVAWIDENGQDYYDALEAALYPPVGLDYIEAVYTQTGTVYNTDSLDSLKSDLVVTAYYDGGTSETVTNYTLSGTLSAGTSTITVTYGGKITTFTVVVSIDTTVQIEYEDKMLAYYQAAVQLRDQTNAGVTIVYNMDSATTALYPAGVIPTEGGVFSSSYGVLQVLKDGAHVNYVDENNRWAKTYDSSHTYTEFKNSWTVSEYNQIRFTVDKRCIDDAYMYDYTTGNIWFAGVNTPYYGMSNISEATP